MATAKNSKTTTTAVAKAKISLPANINAQMAAELEAYKERLAAPTGNKIQTTGKKFKLPDGRETTEPIQVIIVDFINTKHYYDRPFNPKEVYPPACFAIDVKLHKHMTAAKESPNVQSKSDCAGCWANEFGSAGNGKACKDEVLMAVIPPDASEGTPLMLIKASPTALAGFNGYAAAVAREFGTPLWGVITEISFDDSVDYEKLVFDNPEGCTEDQKAQAFSRKQEAQQMLSRLPDVAKYEAPKAAKGNRRAA